MFDVHVYLLKLYYQRRPVMHVNFVMLHTHAFEMMCHCYILVQLII